MMVIRTDKEYWIVWDEKKWRGTYRYYNTITARSLPEAREFYYQEQAARYSVKAPNMFHAKITAKRPDDLDRREKGHYYIYSAKREN